MKIARLILSAVLGVIVTFGLLVLMYSLIESAQQAPDESATHKIADIWQTEREITDQLKELKPEKPDDPDEPPPDLPDEKVDLEARLDSISMAAPKVGGLKVGFGAGFARDSDYIPVYVPQPRYPRTAQRRGVGGYAVIEVTITTSGGVRDPKLLEEYPERMGFGSSALKAAEKLKYNPRVVDGKPEEVPGVLYKFTFQIEQ